MTDYDQRHVTKRRALEALVERCLTSDEVLWRCLENLTPEMFTFDYDLRVAFFSTVGRLGKGTWDPATNRDRLVLGLAALDRGLDPNGADLATQRDYWDRVIDDWYDPFTVVGPYVEALIAALIDMNEIEAETAAVLRDNFANAPLAVDQGTEDAVWDRIRTAALGRRSLRFSTAVPALPRANATDWEGITARVYQ
jgi:hypothetical protein